MSSSLASLGLQVLECGLILGGGRTVAPPRSRAMGVSRVTGAAHKALPSPDAHPHSGSVAAASDVGNAGEVVPDPGWRLQVPHHALSQQCLEG